MAGKTLAPDRKRFKKFEVIGIIIACVCAPLLHFTYEWSGGSFIAGLFSAVNESVWEHTKIIYFPILGYAIVEYFILKPDFKRFFAAKTVALAFASLVTISFFYTYTGIFGAELLAVDIACTFVWIILASVIATRLYYSDYRLERYFALFALLFFGQLGMEILFTPFAPGIGLPLFMDPESGVFGFA